MKQIKNNMWIAGMLAIMLVSAATQASDRSAQARRSSPKRIAYRTVLPPLPAELKVEARGPGDSSEQRRAQASPSALTRQARLAAHWAAAELVRSAGLGESFRVGFFDGQREAWDDPWLGVADLEDGREVGFRDPAARRAGRDAGRRDAEIQALRWAARDVEAQFRDLTREPNRDLPLPAAQFEGDLPPIAPLPLRDLIEAQSFAQLRLDPQWGRHLLEWNLSPWQLHSCAERSDFYAADWGSPARGLALVAVDSRQSRFYTRLTPAEREAFEFHFARELRHRIAARFQTSLEEAYQEGFLNGWSWGAWLREEAAYEEGYAQGAFERAERAAQSSFERAWEMNYVRAVDAEFARWSNQAVIELGAIEVLDLDRDGVIAPGDDVEIFVDWVNYGGASAREVLAVDGSELLEPAQVTLDADARQQSTQPARLVARVDERAANGILDVWHVQVAEASISLETRIQTPLQISAPRVVVRDVERGQLIAVVDVSNISRRARGGRLSLRAEPWAAVEQKLDGIAPGATVAVEMQLDDLDGLELIAGNVGLETELRGEQAAHNVALRTRVQGSARDLSSDELHRWVVKFGSQTALDAQTRQRARELLLERLQADWRRAIKGRGNPYKRDLKQGSAQTEVGEWIRLQRAHRSAGQENVVLLGFHRDLSEVARDLPGAHPFLRRALRKLVARLA